jgi:hypothetical protein
VLVLEMQVLLLVVVEVEMALASDPDHISDEGMIYRVRLDNIRERINLDTKNLWTILYNNMGSRKRRGQDL